MIELTLDMEQYDCPFIGTTDDHDVAFSTVNWELDSTADTLETRMIVDGGDRSTLEGGLFALREHDQILDYELRAKRDGVSQIRSVIPTTNAMSIIQEHDGYITGPFQIHSGSEQWQIGFDTSAKADGAMSALDIDNEFTVESRSDIHLPDMKGFAETIGAAMTLIEGCRDLSPTERRTLEVAVKSGYFERPRDADLGALVDEFDISKAAASHNLRRGQRRVLTGIVDALDSIESNDGDE